MSSSARELAGECFRGRDADFRPRVGQIVPAASRVIIEPTTLQMASVLAPFLLGFALRGQRVRGFAGLADANRQLFLIDDRIAIAELAAVIHFHGNFREPLDHEFAGQPGVPARAAGHDLDVAELAEFLLGDVHLVEEYLAGIQRHAAEQRVAHGARAARRFPSA